MTDMLEGWDIHHGDDVDWIPWGSSGQARAKVLATADGYVVVLVEASPGYEASPHEHTYPEFLYVLDGAVDNEGVAMRAGDAYAAATGTVHSRFLATERSTYLTVFRV